MIEKSINYAKKLGWKSDIFKLNLNQYGYCDIMKKIIIPLLVLILIIPLVLGQGQQGGQQSGTGQQQAGQGRGGETGQQIQTKARNTTELKQMIQEREQEMNQSMQGLKEELKEMYQNQNRVRLAVHALLAMENLTGGIGRNVSQIAKEFNNSVQATIRAEERIQTRNMLMRFFFGGDEQAAEEMEQEVNRNRERIQELRRLMQECECDEEVKAMLQEQIQNMEQEQNRIQELAQNEKKSKGIFGWLWK